MVESRSARKDVVDDPHHHRAHRPILRVEHLARAVALVEHDHALVGAGADGVDRDQIVAAILLDDEKAARVVERVLDRPVDLMAYVDIFGDERGSSAPISRLALTTS